MFSQPPLTFPCKISKICYVLGLLRGRVLLWEEACYARGQLEKCGWETAKFKTRSPECGDYLADFLTLVVRGSWNEETLCYIFIKRLNEQLKDELATWDIPSELQAVVTLVVRLDNRIRDRQKKKSSSLTSPSPNAVAHSSSLVK